jgi:hypothetical protein
MYKAKERLHLASDGKTVVKPGDPRSASLLINEGGEMSDEDAKKYGLIGGESKTESKSEDALPLENPNSSTKLPVPSTPEASPFPQTLKFGGPREAPKETPPAPTEVSPIQPMSAPESTQPSTPEPMEEKSSGDDQLPDEFPFKTILVDQDFGSKAKVKSASKEQLLGLKQIGSERADAIMAAAANL